MLDKFLPYLKREKSFTSKLKYQNRSGNRSLSDRKNVELYFNI